MSDSLRPRRDWAGVIGPWLAIAVVCAGVVLRFGALEEAKQIAIDRDVRQDRTLERHDERLRAIETARNLELQVARLATKIESLEGQVSNMREELARKRR